MTRLKSALIFFFSFLGVHAQERVVAIVDVSLVPTLKCHVERQDAAWKLSDHCPIIVDFDS